MAVPKLGLDMADIEILERYKFNPQRQIREKIKAENYLMGYDRGMWLGLFLCCWNQDVY